MARASRGVRLDQLVVVVMDPFVRACPVPVQAVVGIELFAVEKDMPIELLRCQNCTVIFDDRFEWSFLMVILSGHFGWSFWVVILDGHFGWSF